MFRSVSMGGEGSSASPRSRNRSPISYRSPGSIFRGIATWKRKSFLTLADRKLQKMNRNRADGARRRHVGRTGRQLPAQPVATQPPTDPDPNLTPISIPTARPVGSSRSIPTRSATSHGGRRAPACRTSVGNRRRKTTRSRARTAYTCGCHPSARTTRRSFTSHPTASRVPNILTTAKCCLCPKPWTTSGKSPRST